MKDDSLVAEKPACAAPCWQGITPGETKWSDALTSLEDLPDIDKPQTQKAQDGPAVGAQWQPTGGEMCCQVISEDGETVTAIFLQLAPTHTLGELIARQGDPKYAIGTPGNDEQAIINLFYPDTATIVFVFVAGAKNGTLSDSSEIIAAYYTTPAKMAETMKSVSLYAWNGYQPFSAYAPDAPNANFAITAAPTATATPGQ